MLHKALLLTTLFLAGCAPAYIHPPLQIHHPAHPEATQATFDAPSDVLAAGIETTEVVIQDPPGMPHTSLEGVNHGERVEGRVVQADDAHATSAPDEAPDLLKKVLDSYLVIGDRLASDTLEEVAEQAKQISPALDALTKTEIPGDPHFWHMRDGVTRTIRQQAQALADAIDLSTARTAYRMLSAPLAQLIGDIGGSHGYEKLLYRTSCGPTQDTPEKGTWLQLGDDPRSPYGGPTAPCQHEQLSMPEMDSSQQQHEHDTKHGGHR